MEIIEIKNFASIKDITLEIKPINILMGTGASGKSTIAKLLYYFKSLMSEIINPVGNSANQEDLDENYQRKFKNYFSPSLWKNQEFYLKYSTQHGYIEIYPKELTVEKQSVEIVLNYSKFARHISTSSSSLSKSQKNHIRKIAPFTPLYIPASRGLFVIFKNSMFSAPQTLSSYWVDSVDPFIVEFGTSYEEIESTINKTAPAQKLIHKNIFADEIVLLAQKILGGEYLQKDGEDYLELKDGRQIRLANSSSGQQQILPSVIILSNIALTESKIDINSVYIEEPEARIFPAAQKDIVNLIATVYNARKDNLQFVITTHSPYILTSFNNLLQAGILAIDATEDKIEKISRHVPKTRFLNPEEVAVYALDLGYCQSIIDRDTGLIDTNIIDEVSNELAIQFDELLDIEKIS